MDGTVRLPCHPMGKNTQAAAWDFACLNRNPKQLTDLVTDLKGQGTNDEMLRMFYDMPSLQSLLERCSISDCADGSSHMDYSEFLPMAAEKAIEIIKNFVREW